MVFSDSLHSTVEVSFLQIVQVLSKVFGREEKHAPVFAKVFVCGRGFNQIIAARPTRGDAQQFSCCSIGPVLSPALNRNWRRASMSVYPAALPLKAVWRLRSSSERILTRHCNLSPAPKGGNHA